MTKKKESNELEAGFRLFTKEEAEILDKVSPQALAVYWHLKKRINHLRGDDMAFPGGKTLLTELGYSSKSKATLTKILGELEDVGLVRVERSYNSETRRWNTNKYYLLGRGSSLKTPRGSSVETPRVVSGNYHNQDEFNQDELNQIERNSLISKEEPNTVVDVCGKALDLEKGKSSAPNKNARFEKFDTNVPETDEDVMEFQRQFEEEARKFAESRIVIIPQKIVEVEQPNVGVKEELNNLFSEVSFGDRIQEEALRRKS